MAKQCVNLGKNYENQVYPPNLEAFVGKTMHKTWGRMMIFWNFMHPWCSRAGQNYFLTATVPFLNKSLLAAKVVPNEQITVSILIKICPLWCLN